MKAWRVNEGGNCPEANLLIFASTRERARFIAFTHGTWEYDTYVDTHAVRAPKWDDLFDCEKVIDANEDLPIGAEPFYSDEEHVL